MLLDTFPYIPLPGRAGNLMLSSEALQELGTAAAQYLGQLTPPLTMLQAGTGGHLPTLPAGQRGEGTAPSWAEGLSSEDSSRPLMQRLSPTSKQKLDYAEPPQPTWSSQPHSQSRWSRVCGSRRLLCSTAERASCCFTPAASQIMLGWTCRVCTNPASECELVGRKQQTANRLRQDGSRVRHSGLQHSKPGS